MSPLAALSLILVIGCAAPSNAHQEQPQHRQKRALPAIPFLIAEKSGGKGQGPPLAEHEVMMNTPINQGMLIEESFSGPLALTGGIMILLSLAMAVSYQASNNALIRARNININRRSGEARAASQDHEYISNLMGTLASAAQKWQRR